MLAQQDAARQRRTTLGYSLMVVGAIAAYLAIRHTGSNLPLPAPRDTPLQRSVSGRSEPLEHVLLALAVICLFARLLGGLLQRFLHQPAVIGEIAAGLVLGPSVLGAIAPGAYEFLLPASAAPFLGILAKVGVVLFMFLVGLEVDGKLLRRNSHATLVISHASIVVPFLLGSSLALLLYTQYSTEDVGFTAFSLFLGVSMSITAFPVLARILADRGALKTPLGTMALGCAAFDDVTAWTLLALIVGFVSAEEGDAMRTVVYVTIYIVAMFAIVRPLLRALVAREDARGEAPRRTALAVTFGLLLLSAFATEAIGIHGLFGAFLLGALMPHEGHLAEQLRKGLGDVVVILLLPAFFAFTGMRTQIGLIQGAQDWAICLSIILVAVIGKFGGSTAAGRLVGMSWRDASAVGILMNTRGLMELIALNLGLDLGVITPKIFAMMVLMALATTFMASPILNLVLGERGFDGQEAAPKIAT